MPKKNTRTHVKELGYKYFPAVLRKTKGCWYVEYYVENPENETFERMRLKMNNLRNHFQTNKDAQLHINQIVSALNVKLAGGWNLFYEQREDSRIVISTRWRGSTLRKKKRNCAPIRYALVSRFVPYFYSGSIKIMSEFTAE